jgi:hypothetical protein
MKVFIMQLSTTSRHFILYGQDILSTLISNPYKNLGAKLLFCVSQYSALDKNHCSICTLSFFLFNDAEYTVPMIG